MPARNRPRLLVLNQSLSPAFVGLMERLAARIGPVEIWTGTEVESACRDVTILPMPTYDRTSMRGRARTWASFSASATARLATRRADLILAVTNPPGNPQIGWLAKHLLSIPYGLLLWDLYPDHVVRLGLAKPSASWVRAWEGWNGRVFREAAFVVTLGRQMKALIERRYGAQVDVIPNWADTEMLRPRAAESNRFAIRHSLVGKKVVMYSGNLGASHDLGPMLEAARAMSGRSDVQFVIVGDGLGVARVRNEVGAAANVLLMPRQPWEELPYSLAAADVSVVAQAEGSEELSVPSKTYGSLAVGSAIAAITSASSDLGALVNDHHVGFVARERDAFKLRLEQLLDDPEGLDATKVRARALAESRFTEEAVAEAWLEVLARALR